MTFFKPKQRYQGANYPGITLMQILCRLFIGSVVAIMLWSVFTGDTKENMRKLEESRADRLIAEVREEQFRECLKKAAGLGVATTNQMNKCKELYLTPSE